jgi:glutaminyl-tRNA synthetase
LQKISIYSSACVPANFPDGSRTLRAKIDMASPNLNMRDPVMYRILHAEHHRTGN